MRKWMITMWLLWLFGAAAFASDSAQPRIEFFFYHDVICESCEGEKAFLALCNSEMAGVQTDHSYVVFPESIYTEAGKGSLETKIAENGLVHDGVTWPVLIVNGKLYAGMDTIKANLKEAYLTAEEDLKAYGEPYNPLHKLTGTNLFSEYSVRDDCDTIAYFYRTVCDECLRTKPIIDALPEGVDVIPINTRARNNSERIMAFFDAYEVPDEHRMVPIVFMKGGYLSGYDAIEANLAAWIKAGMARDFAFPIVTPSE